MSAPHLRRPGHRKLAVSLLLVIGCICVSVSSASAASTTIDDRALAAKGKWAKVKLKSAVNKTVSRSKRKGAKLTTRTAATAGGSVVLIAGPKRGSVVVKVDGKKVAAAKTSAKKSRRLAVAFSGAGRVSVTVAKPGRAGVYVDAIVLNSQASSTTPGGGGTTPGGTAFGGALTQIDTSAGGEGGNGEAAGYYALSPDRTKLAFWSRATNLVPGVTDGRWHLYVKTVAGAGSGSTGVYDTSSNGTLGNDNSTSSEYRGVAWKPDGTEVLFTSGSTNLTSLSGWGNGPYLYSKSLIDQSVGVIADVVGGDVAWSPDGAWIAYSSRWNPILGQFVNNPQLFAWRVDNTGTYVAISADSSGVVANGYPSNTSHPVWSPDSTRVAFSSNWNGYVAGDTNAADDVFVKTIATGAIVRVSTTSTGAQGNAGSEWPAFSPDGGRIAFDSGADNLAPGDTNSSRDVFVKNLTTGAVSPVSVDKAGAFWVGLSQVPKWSPDGSKIAFETEAYGLNGVGPDSNVRRDVYVKNLATGAVQMASVRPDGGNGNSSSGLWGFTGNTGVWSADGSAIYFATYASNFSTDNNAFATSLFRKQL